MLIYRLFNRGSYLGPNNKRLACCENGNEWLVSHCGLYHCDNLPVAGGSEKNNHTISMAGTRIEPRFVSCHVYYKDNNTVTHMFPIQTHGK